MIDIDVLGASDDYWVDLRVLETLSTRVKLLFDSSQLMEWHRW